MKRTRRVFAGCGLVFLCFFLLAPQKATGTVETITAVSRGSLDLTAKLDDAARSEIAAALSDCKRSRWKNPINVYPLENDTIIIECEDEAGTHRFVFVGSQNRFAEDSYRIFGGAEIFARVVEILEA